MWRPNENSREIGHIKDWVSQNNATPEETVLKILQTGTQQMAQLNRKAEKPKDTVQPQARGLCTEAPWEEIQHIVQLQKTQTSPEELREDANTVWKAIKQEQQQRVPLPWPLLQFAGHVEGIARSKNALQSFFHKKPPSPYEQCETPEEWKGAWKSVWQKHSRGTLTVEGLCGSHMERTVATTEDGLTTPQTGGPYPDPAER